MEVFLQALFTTLIIFGPAGLVLAYSAMNKKGLLEEIDELKSLSTRQDSILSGAVFELEDTKKHLSHAISELKILQGGIMENDDLLDNLYEREKLVVQELEEIKLRLKPQFKSKRVKLASKAIANQRYATIAPKPKVKSSRRMK